ncbi:MAG TPA: hypothetical protein VG943_10350 [Caulobacterales bacterium]|nr:hypothetical protein [Caulobacterales bacterium]
MTDLVFTDLGAAGVDYVREHLLGANVFCTALLAVVEAAPGKVTTLAPQGVSRERLLRFDEGGLLDGTENNRVVRIEDRSPVETESKLKVEQAAYLVSMLRTVPDAVCIVDDFNPSWSDIDINADPNAFGVGDEVYRLFTMNDAPPELAQALIASDTAWHGVAALCAETPDLDAVRETSAEDLERAALSAFIITCTAYDGEGFVIWRRT